MMKPFNTFTLNIHGRHVEFDRPAVMGILNVTPDSFYAGSRTEDRILIEARVKEMLAEGADMIDVGGYSSRPGAKDVAVSEELRRVEQGLEVIRRISEDVIVSVDTFRSEVAKMAVNHYKADIINDISGGNIDDRMFETVADLRVPYILMHMRGTPADMQTLTDYNAYGGDVTAGVIAELSGKIDRLSLMGVNDVIVDPGFGFCKTVEQNYQLLGSMSSLTSLGCPLLVGVSRKSMIFKALGCTPGEALNGTTVINTLALERGASILRVHDVKQACEAIKLVGMLTPDTPQPPIYL